MYKASKSKIVLTIVATLILFLGTTLTAIYVSTYLSVHEKNANMLKIYTETYWVKGSPEGNLKNLMPTFDTSEKSKLRYSLSFFYSVAFSADGAVITVDNEMPETRSDDYFIQLSKRLETTGKATGTIDQWMYRIETQKGVTLVAFKNNEILDDDMMTLLKNTIGFGAVAILLLIWPSIYLAHRIVEPLETSYIKQKQFISNASHDLKTPLTVMLTNAEMLETGIGENKWLNYIKYEVQLMGGLVNQLLALTRSEQGKLKLSPIDLSRVVLGSALPFETLAFEKEKKLEINIEENLSVLGDEGEMANLVSILLDNALEYAPKGTNIELNLRAHRQQVHLTVSNESPPFTTEELDKLFDRFYRMDSARTGNSHFGLGLSIARAIVFNHQGKIAAMYENNRLWVNVELPRVNQ